MNNVPVIFPLAKSHPRRSPVPRRKLIVSKSSTSKADESKRDRQEFGRLREELGRVLHLK